MDVTSQTNKRFLSAVTLFQRQKLVEILFMLLPVTQVIMEYPDARLATDFHPEFFKPLVNLFRLQRVIGQQRAFFNFWNACFNVTEITQDHMSHNQTVDIVEHQR